MGEWMRPAMVGGGVPWALPRDRGVLPGVRWGRSTTVAVLVVALVASLLAVRPFVATPPAGPAPADTTADEPLAARDASALYFRPGATPGLLEADNPGTGISATLSAAALEVTARGSEAPVRLVTSGFGRIGAVAPATVSALPLHTDTTATILRGALVEWYRNAESGLEQGWTVSSRPAGSGELVLDLTIEGGAAAVAAPTAAHLRPSGGGLISYGGLMALDAQGRSLPARFEATASGLRIAVDDAHADYPVVIDPVLAAVEELEAVPNATNTRFGNNVVVDDRWMLIGTGADRVAPTTQVMSVYVYFDTSGQGDWVLLHRLETAASLDPGLALDVEPEGVTVVAGGADVKVWTIAGDPVTQAPTAPVAGPQAISATPRGVDRSTSAYGRALDLDGGLLVVGANGGWMDRFTPDGADAGTAPDRFFESTGTVEVLRRTGGFGTPFALEAQLDPPGGMQEPDPNLRDIRQNFGQSVAVDGDLIAVGAGGDDGVLTPTAGTLAAPSVPGTTTNQGAVHLFRRAAGTWSPAAVVTEPVRYDSATFGISVDLAGGDLLAGAWFGPGPGRALLFDHTGEAGSDAWNLVSTVDGEDPTTTFVEAKVGDRCGTSVDFDDAGQRFAIGCINLEVPGVRSGGTVVFSRPGTGPGDLPVRLAHLRAPPSPLSWQGAQLGSSVSIDGDEVVAGAPIRQESYNPGRGGAVTYHATGGSFTDSGKELAPQADRFSSEFGTAVAQDGDLLVVSAPAELRTLGVALGALQVFERDGDQWVLDTVLPSSHGALSATSGIRFGPVAVHVRRDAEGNDTGAWIAVGIPDDPDIDLDGRGDPEPITVVGPATGTVGVYVRNGGPGTAWDGLPAGLWAGGNDSWNQAGQYDPGTLTPGGRFGSSVAFTDDGTLVVGEPGANGGLGALHRFELSASSQNRRYAFRETVAGTSDAPLGLDVAADGSTVVSVAAAANGATAVSTFQDGAAADDLAAGRAFQVGLSSARSLSVDAADGRLAIGSTADAAVRVYRTPGSGGAYQLEDTFTGESDSGFGADVALSRGADQVSVAVGAPEIEAATVYIARVRSDGRGVWSEAATLDRPAALGGRFGAAVTNWPDDGGVLVGAPLLDDPDVDAGRVYGFTTSGLAPPPGPEAFVDVTAPGQVPAGAAFVPTAGLPPSLLTANAQSGGSIAAAPIGGIDLSQPPTGTTVSASPLSSLPLSSLPLSSLDLAGAPLSSLPLSSLPLSSLPLSSLPGGWETLLTGTNFEGSPLQSITFADVQDLSQVQALTIGQLGLGASPLSSLPLSSLVLGGTPLSSLPISGGDPLSAWCDAVVDLGYEPADLGLDCEDLTNPANESVNLVSLGLAGVPLSSLPLSSLPLSSLPLSSLPLSSLPLSSLDLAGSPLSSLPLSSLPLSSLPLSSLPLSSLPLSSLPLSSLPLSSLDLDPSPLSSLPLSSLPLSSLDLARSPLSSLPLSSLPLSSLPLSSLPLSSLPLSSLPLSSLPLSSLKLAGSPLSSLPLSSLDLAGSPLSSLPLSSLPLSSLPLSSLPLSSLPLSSLDLDPSPLSSLPLSSLPLSSLANPVTGELRSAPLSSLPLSSLPLSSLSLVVDCTVFDCTLPDVTLGDAARAGVVRQSARMGLLVGALDGIRLGDIAGVIDGVSIEDVRASLDGFTLADFQGAYDDLSLGEMSVLHAFLTLGDIAPALSGIRLGDIASRIDGFTSADLIAALVEADLTLDSLSSLDDLTLGELPQLAALLTFQDLADGLSGFRLADLVDAIATAGGTYGEADLRAALEAALGADATLGDLGDLDDLTLGELAGLNGTTLGQLFAVVPPELLDGITLGDLLLALIARSQYPWERLDYSRVTAQALDAGDGSVPISVAFGAEVPDGHARTVRVEVRPPFGSALVPGSVSLSLPVPAEELEPQVLDGALVWTFTNVPASAVSTLSFAVEPTVQIGGGQVVATATLLEDDESAVDRTDLRVVEVLEPNDTPAQATPLPEDTIVLSHVSSADDVDLFAFTVTDPGTRVSIKLSNLDADLDAVLYSPKASSTEIQTPSPRSIIPVEDEDESAIPSFETVPPEPVEDLAVPADLGDLAVNQASINRGARDEQIDTGVLQRTGTYYVAVSGYNGATSRQPYALRLKRLATPVQPACPARSVPAGTVGSTLPAALPDGTDTVFLVNRSRLEGLWGDSAGGALAAVDQLVAYLNDPAQDALGVTAAVLPVDADPDVRSAYAAWDAQPCLPEGANGVAAEIVRLLNGYRAAGTELRHIVVVGGDDAIPFARVPDRTDVANESDYASTFSDAGTALYATFATSHVLTDDAYGDLDPYGFGDRVLFVTDTAVGRLVETPGEIADQVGDFIAAGGRLAVGTALVTGYDFLTDGAQEVAGELDATYGSVDQTLISDTWTRGDLEAAIAALTPDLAAVNAHFDHFRALPGAGNATGDESDLFTAAAVRGQLDGALAGSIVFSMGCHSGLSASDQLVSGDRALDFAQAVAAQGGVFVGNTGYGYGDTELVALSERLMSDFAQRLDGSLSVGEALLYAKAEYAADLTAYGVYDEKVLMESTLYGLPFYRLDVADPPPVPPLPPAPQVHPDPVSGIDTSTIQVTPVHEERTGPAGETYFVGVDPETGEEQTTAVHDRPVQPRAEGMFTAPAGTEAHDALVLGLTTTDAVGVDPYLFDPVVDSSAERSTAAADVVFPSSPVRVNPQLTPAGEAYTLSATTGYFRTTATDGSGVQRLIDDLTVAPHFVDDSSTDFTRPVFSVVEATVDDGTLSFAVRVSDDQGGAAGVRRVYVLAVGDPEPGTATTWVPVDLVRAPGTDRWTGSLALDGDELEYLVQAVDGAGNVAITTNKALNFRDATLPLDPPSTDLDVQVAGSEGQQGWYTSPVTVTATGGTSLTYEVVGRTAEQPYTGAIPLTEDGPHTVVIRSADGQRSTTRVRIDTHGPVALIGAPMPGSVLSHASGATADFACLDAGSGAERCTATLERHHGFGSSPGEISPIAVGDDVTDTVGQHVLRVTTDSDVAGNAPQTAEAASTFSVVPRPKVTAVRVPNTPGPAEPVVVEAAFTGHPLAGPYTASFTWSDGSVTTCRSDTPSADCEVAITPDGAGSARASRVVSAPSATNTVAVVITDALGASDTGTASFTRTTAISATPILLKLKLFGGLSIVSGSISATLTDADGRPMANRSISFSTTLGSLCTATTDATGRAACPTSVGISLAAVLAGSYGASFAGDPYYLGVATTAPLILVS